MFYIFINIFYFKYFVLLFYIILVRKFHLNGPSRCGPLTTLRKLLQACSLLGFFKVQYCDVAPIKGHLLGLEFSRRVANQSAAGKPHAFLHCHCFKSEIILFRMPYFIILILLRASCPVIWFPPNDSELCVRFFIFVSV